MKTKKAKQQETKEVKKRAPRISYVSDSGIVIEQGVPIPEVDDTGRAEKYPFKTMEVGDSFFIATIDKKKAMNLRSILKGKALKYNKMARNRRKSGLTIKNFVALIQEENNQLGVRCWRTK